MENIKYKTLKVKVNTDIEYVSILDKVRTTDGNDQYLVVVCGEPAKCYANGKRYKDIIGKEEIVTPNMGKVFLIEPNVIIEVANYA